MVRLLIVIRRKLRLVFISENMLVIVVVMVNLNVIRLEVLFISVLFFSRCIRCLGSCFWVIVEIVRVFVGDSMVVRVKEVVRGIFGISRWMK